MSDMERSFTATSFQMFLNEGRLMGARCVDTGEIFVPPRPMCPRTHSTRMEWVELSGLATLLTFTSIYIGTTAMIEAGFDRQHPYCSGIVELVEGPRISAQIMGFDPAQPQEIRLGQRLRVTHPVPEVGGKVRHLVFEPV